MVIRADVENGTEGILGYEQDGCAVVSQSSRSFAAPDLVLAEALVLLHRLRPRHS